MPADPETRPTSEPDQLDVTTEQAIAACGVDARNAVKALIVANESLETQIAELQAAVSNGYARAANLNSCRLIGRIGMIELRSGHGHHIFRRVAV
jgi:hypothetical protein